MMTTVWKILETTLYIFGAAVIVGIGTFFFGFFFPFFSPSDTDTDNLKKRAAKVGVDAVGAVIAVIYILGIIFSIGICLWGILGTIAMVIGLFTGDLPVEKIARYVFALLRLFLLAILIALVTVVGGWVWKKNREVIWKLKEKLNGSC